MHGYTYMCMCMRVRICLDVAVASRIDVAASPNGFLEVLWVLCTCDAACCDKNCCIGFRSVVLSFVRSFTITFNSFAMRTLNFPTPSAETAKF